MNYYDKKLKKFTWHAYVTVGEMHGEKKGAEVTESDQMHRTLNTAASNNTLLSGR